MSIDAHIHLFDPARGSYAWPPRGDPFYRCYDIRDFLKASAGCGVEGAVLVACSSEPELMRYLLETYAGEDRILAIIGQADGNEPDFTARYDEYARHPKFRGMRISARAACADRLLDNIAHMRNRRANVLEILGDYPDILKLDRLFEQSRGLRLVIEHFGGIALDGGPLPQAYLSFLLKMASYSHIYMKVSALMTRPAASPAPLDPARYRPLIRAVWDAFGEDRCLFGSDWPVMSLACAYHHAVEMTETLLTEIGETALQKGMAQNARDVYQIDRR